MSLHCEEIKNHLSEHLDSTLTGTTRAQVVGHLAACDACRSEMETLQRTVRLVGAVGRKPAPPDLSLRLRIALSQEMARKARPWYEPLVMHWQNAARAFMLPATAGVVSAVLFFGLIIGFMAVPQFAGEDEIPSSLFTPAELMMAPNEAAVGGSINADSLVVDAYIDANGRVQDYRIVSGPPDAAKHIPQLENMLIFTVFRPATAFGQPTASRVVLSFSKVNVKG
jgi:putative zinc finger protein